MGGSTAAPLLSVERPPDAVDSVHGRVVEAADRLIYARGIQAVGMDEICLAAGVTLRRLYAEFGSKDGVLLAVLRRRHASWVRGLEAAVAATADGPEQLLAVYDFLAGWFADPTFRGCGFINAFGELGGSSALVAACAREHKHAFGVFLARLVSRAGYDPALAPQLALLAEGAQTTAAIEGTPAAAGDARRAAVTLIDAARRSR